MASRKRLIVGLGNPGIEYEQTRHNVGFMVADAVASRLDLSLEAGRGPAQVGCGRFRSRPLCVVKPLTFMNRSGGAVRHHMNKLKVAREDILVIFDDLNLDLGVIRIRQSGSAGGHNGMQDIIDVVGSNEIPRLRIGIGSQFRRGKQAEYVLSPFEDDELELLEDTIQAARDAAFLFTTEGVLPAMNRYNKRK